MQAWSAGHISATLEEGGLLAADTPTSSQGSPRGVANSRRRIVTVVANVLVIFALVCVMAWPRGAQLQHGEAASRITLFTPLALGSMVLEGATGASGWKTAVTQPLQQVRHEIQNSQPLDVSNMTNLTFEQLIPRNNVLDGNICRDEEEELGGLCYERCAVITGGVFPLRTSSWSCCQAQPCTFFNSKFTSPLSLCEGLDVSGVGPTRACPHTPGSCLVNEEFNLGRCYKKCALLTNSSFPFRSVASTCCKYNSHWACLDAINTISSPTFDIGGGGGDGHASTPKESHPPIPLLTEA